MDGASNKHLQLQNVKINMDEKAWAIIKAIIAKGNDAIVRKKGDGYIVLEDKREIKFQAKETRPG